MASEVAGTPGSRERVALGVCRAGKVMSVQVALACEDGLGTARIVHWCGAQLQVQPPLPPPTTGSCNVPPCMLCRCSTRLRLSLVLSCLSS